MKSPKPVRVAVRGDDDVRRSFGSILVRSLSPGDDLHEREGLAEADGIFDPGSPLRRMTGSAVVQDCVLDHVVGADPACPRLGGAQGMGVR